LTNITCLRCSVCSRQAATRRRSGATQLARSVRFPGRAGELLARGHGRRTQGSAGCRCAMRLRAGMVQCGRRRMRARRSLRTPPKMPAARPSARAVHFAAAHWNGACVASIGCPPTLKRARDGKSAIAASTFADEGGVAARASNATPHGLQRCASLAQSRFRLCGSGPTVHNLAAAVQAPQY
jgi:hypothetical protein